MLNIGKMIVCFEKRRVRNLLITKVFVHLITNLFVDGWCYRNNYSPLKINSMETRKKLSYGIVFGALLVCSVVTLRAAKTMPEDEKIAATKAAPAADSPKPITAGEAEANRLIYALLSDHLIDEGKGFTVERRKENLILNGEKQSVEIAKKYLENIKEENIWVQVLPYAERLMKHPGTNTLQLMIPVNLSSPCASYSVGKEGC